MDVNWQRVGDYEDIIFEKSDDGIARVTINRPQVRNAFRPLTVTEMIDAFADAREDLDIGVVILTGAGDEAFCSGGDQKVRGEAGYVGEDKVPRLNVLDLQHLIRYIPKPVIAAVAGYAIGGGHVLHLVCDLTIAAENARFGQTGPRVGSFDAGYGAGLLARTVGQKKAKEIWYLCRQYDAQEALAMGLVNTVVPVDRLQDEAVQWAREILAHQSDRDPIPEGRIQRRHGRTGGDPAACRRCDPSLLHDRRGQRRQERLSRKAEARFLEVPAAAVVRGDRGSRMTASTGAANPQLARRGGALAPGQARALVRWAALDVCRSARVGRRHGRGAVQRPSRKRGPHRHPVRQSTGSGVRGSRRNAHVRALRPAQLAPDRG